MKIRRIFSLMVFALIAFTAKAQLSGNKYQMDIEGIGIITLEFKTDTYSLYDPEGSEAVHGDYKVSENTITFVDTGGPTACSSDDSGRYTLTFEANSMKLTLIEDACSGRAMIADGTWEKVSE